MKRHTGRQTVSQIADTQTHRQTHRQIDRHTVEWVESLSVTHDDQSVNNTGRGQETF